MRKKVRGLRIKQEGGEGGRRGEENWGEGSGGIKGTFEGGTRGGKL